MSAEPTRAELVALEIADPADRWEAVGFGVSPEGLIELGGVQLKLGARGEGIVSWTLRGIDTTDSIDGLRTRVVAGSSGPEPPAPSRPIDQSVNQGRERAPERPASACGGQATGAAPGPAAVSHPNGAVAVDHVVILTSDFDRTASAVAAAGMPLRRLAQRDGARQGFRRLGPAIMEIVQAPEVGATRFWGLVVIVSDLDALADRLGDLLARIRPAVQPGRRIAPLRSAAGLGPAVAFMDPS